MNLRPIIDSTYLLTQLYHIWFNCNTNKNLHLSHRKHLSCCNFEPNQNMWLWNIKQRNTLNMAWNMSQRLTIYPSTVAKISSFFRWNPPVPEDLSPSGKSGTKLCDRSQLVMAAHDSTCNWSWEEDEMWFWSLKLTSNEWSIVDPDWKILSIIHPLWSDCKPTCMAIW